MIFLPKYCFDTSGFIFPYRNAMPPDIVPTLWARLDSMIDEEEIVASKEVYLEISQKDDTLLKWIRDRKKMFIEVDPEQTGYLQMIIDKFEDWVDSDAQKNIADPYSIALAMQLDLTVVSSEKGGSFKNPKIPFVCQEFGVNHLFFFDFLRKIDFAA